MNTLHSLFRWTLDAGLRASLLACAVMLIQAALRGHVSARCRYALWLPVLLVLVMPVLPESRWSAENVLVAQTVEDPLIAVNLSLLESATAMASASAVPPSEPVHWLTIAAAVWACGVVMTLGLGCAGYLSALRRFQRSAVEPCAALMESIQVLCAAMKIRTPWVLISSAVESPAVAGVCCPVLLLPSDCEKTFSKTELALVLKHELMHLKRHDLPVNAVVCVLQALHWFNPLLWFAASRVRADRESACDAQVLASDAGDCRNDYGQVLLKVQSACSPRGPSLGLVGMFEGGRSMRVRITAIARYRRAHPAIGPVMAVVIAALSVVGATRAQTGLPDKAPLPSSAASAAGMAAFVNTTFITQSELQDEIEAQKKTILFRHRDNPKQKEAELKDLDRKALDSLIDRELILQAFNKLGGTIKPKYIDEDIQTIVEKQFKGDRSALIAELAKNGLTLKKFSGIREKMIIVQVMRSRQGGKPQAPTAAEIEEYYTKHSAMWRSEEKKSGETPSVDSVRPEIEKLIKAERMNENFEKWLSDLRAKAVIRRST